MPCRDDWPTPSQEYSAKIESELRVVGPALCAIFTVVEKATGDVGAWIENLDWKEAGVSKEAVLDWWKQHKREDAKRLKREARRKAAAEAKEKLRADALAKLTPEEKKVLGIK